MSKISVPYFFSIKRLSILPKSQVIIIENIATNHTTADEFSPLTLAFVGDGVYDLLVRKYLVDIANRPVGELNKIKVSLVNCKSQANFAKLLIPILNEKELSIYKRGRNAAPKSTSKHGSVADYHSATGLEALFGYLYINNENGRINELFTMIVHNAFEMDSDTDEKPKSTDTQI